MNSSHLHKLPVAARWVARGVSVVLLGLLAPFFFGEGARGLPGHMAANPLSADTLMLLSRALLVLPGYVLGWRWEGWAGNGPGGHGAVLRAQLRGAGRFSRGPVFPLMFVPPVCYLFSGWARPNPAVPQNTA